MVHSDSNIVSYWSYFTDIPPFHCRGECYCPKWLIYFFKRKKMVSSKWMQQESVIISSATISHSKYLVPFLYSTVPIGNYSWQLTWSEKQLDQAVWCMWDVLGSEYVLRRAASALQYVGYYKAGLLSMYIIPWDFQGTHWDDEMAWSYDQDHSFAIVYQGCWVLVLTPISRHLGLNSSIKCLGERLPSPTQLDSGNYIIALLSYLLQPHILRFL